MGFLLFECDRIDVDAAKQRQGYGILTPITCHLKHHHSEADPWVHDPVSCTMISCSITRSHRKTHVNNKPLLTSEPVMALGYMRHTTVVPEPPLGYFKESFLQDMEAKHHVRGA